MGIEVTFQSNVREVMDKVDATARDRMKEATRAVWNQTKINLTGSRTGLMYYVPGSRKKYRASAPGESPAVMLGTLRQSVRMGVESDGHSLTGFVGSEKNYAPMLEFGTSKMKPRPWLRRTFEQMTGRVKEIFTRTWV